MNKREYFKMRFLLKESIEECNIAIEDIYKKYEGELAASQNIEEIRTVRNKIKIMCRSVLYAKKLLWHIRVLWWLFPFTCIDGYKAAKELDYGLFRGDSFADENSYLKCRELVRCYIKDYEKKRGFLYYTMWCIYVLIALIILSIIIVNNS